MNREDWVSHRLSGILYESWDPRQVHAIAILACEAVDEWKRERWRQAVESLTARRDHTIAEAHAYRDGVEDTLDYWEATWGEPCG